MDFSELNNKILLPDSMAMQQSQARWDSIAKPIGSLGLLEQAIVRIAGLTGSAEVQINRRAVLVLCADNGVVAEGISQASSDITSLVAENIARGNGSVSRMAAVAHADIIVVDMGMAKRINAPKLLDRRIAAGTNNIASGPAMTKLQALKAIQTGMDLVRECKENGYLILATGEMGIGNTTTSSAIASVLLGKSVPEVTGRGAGLSDEGLLRKISIINRAIEINAPDANDALDVLAKLGGFDIAGLAGVFIGGAIHRIPILMDGFISAVSALVASRLCPNCACAMLASHASAEPGGMMVLEALGMRPLITAGMRLGEGTGAVCALPLLDMALAVYSEVSTFSDIGMEAYTPQGGYRCEHS